MHFFFDFFVLPAQGSPDFDPKKGVFLPSSATAFFVGAGVRLTFHFYESDEICILPKPRGQKVHFFVFFPRLSEVKVKKSGFFDLFAVS